MPDLSNVALFAAAGSVVAFWGQVKGFLSRISSLVVRCDSFPTAFGAQKFLDEISADVKYVRWGNNTYLHNCFYLARLKINPFIFFTYFKSYPAIYKKRIPLFISESGSGLKVTYLVGTFPIKKIVQKMSEGEINYGISYRDKKKNNFYIEEVSGKDFFGTSMSATATKEGSSSSSTSTEPSPMGAFASTILKQHTQYFGTTYEEIEYYAPEEKNEDYFWTGEALQLDSEIAFWLENRNWYRDRNLSWRRGALLSGRAGTGKTQMVIRCAQKRGLRILKMNIANMSTSEFLENYNCGPYGETIILLEDLDNVYHGRENILAEKTHTKQLLSFDTLINAIGGVKNSSGIFTIITTNHPDQLDSALIRAGRLDAKIDVGPLSREGREFIAKNILRDWPLIIDKVVNECDNFVAAEFENVCVELAITEKNKEKK